MYYKFKLSGVSFGSRQQTIQSLKEGDPIWLHRERYNSFDKNAILVTSNHGKDIGYVPRERNIALATRMDYFKADKLQGTVREIIGGITNQLFGIIVELEFTNEIPDKMGLDITDNIIHEQKTFYYKAGKMQGKMNFEGVLRHIERIESVQHPTELIYSFMDILSEIKTFFTNESLSLGEDDTYYIKGLQLASNLSYQIAYRLFVHNLSLEDIKIADYCEQYILDSFFLLPNDSTRWIGLLESLYFSNCNFAGGNPVINLMNLCNSRPPSLSLSLAYIAN
jgi:hypothetical protein